MGENVFGGGSEILDIVKKRKREKKKDLVIKVSWLL